jgi:LmbE family N-acetylglucosaminyl deacetylase
MKSILRSIALAVLAATAAGAQTWRVDAANLGTTARVLIIGTRPEDEDNALIAWLSLGRNVETAYLALTRGEAGVNLTGNERLSSLAIVRTAELLAERGLDGAHQYFTRAYDIGSTASDSIVEAAWPRDSLVRDVVSIVRAFRPHVIISLFSGDSSEHDATRRVAGRVARDAFALAGDTARLPSRLTSLLPPWTVSRFVSALDGSAGPHGGLIAVDVGEFDRARARSYAEVGADIRRLQRTQPQPPPPMLGHAWRYFRLDASRSDTTDTALFAAGDTSLERFRGTGSFAARALLDSLVGSLDTLRAHASRAPADSLAIALAHVAAQATALRRAIACTDIEGVPACPGTQGDFAASIGRIADVAARTMADAANIVVDGTVERPLIAERDGVPLTVTVFNGGTLPVTVRQLAAASRTASVALVQTTRGISRDSASKTSVTVLPDSVRRWSASVSVNATDFHWWQFHGVMDSVRLYAIHYLPIHPVIAQLISGEDRIPTTGVDATIQIAGMDVRLIKTPLVYRGPGIVRGDDRRPLTGVPSISVAPEHPAEYERAGLPINRLFRVFLSSARTTADTVTVSLTPPKGLRSDSAKRIVVVPPLGSTTVIFRLHGSLVAGRDSAVAVATTGTPPPQNVPLSKELTTFRAYRLGALGRDYPHIPSQQFQGASTDRFEGVDLRLPPRLRVAYVKGEYDLQLPLGQLQVSVQALDASLLSVLDLSSFSTILIGSGALANNALASVVPAVREFMRKGGTVVILPGGPEVATSGLLPYPIAFDSPALHVSDPSAAVRAISPKSPLLSWPNVITDADYKDWSIERARGVPASFDSRYRKVVSMTDPGRAPTDATILAAPVGRGLVVYASLALDTQLAAVNPGAARLLVNLLSAGLDRDTPQR